MPTVKQFIAAMRRNARESRAMARKEKKPDPIKVILVYNPECGLCEMQFNHFINYLGVTFEKGQNIGNKRRIVDRIYPVDVSSKEFARIWDAHFSDVRDFPTPAYIDVREWKIIATGMQTGKALRNLTNYNRKKVV